MIYRASKKEAVRMESGHGHCSYPLLREEHGCTKGCCTGISHYASLSYTPPAIHEDQEGFYVISGSGAARIAGEEFLIAPDMSLIAPAGAEHQFRSDSEQIPLVLFWFHAQA